MKKCCKILALLLIVLSNTFSLKAQDDDFSRYQVGVKSPEASNLGLFGDIPVSLFNGLPEISIPLSDVKCGDISFPVSLQYYAGGNRPNQHPGWTGLGWTLNAGGVITRQINGFRDEYTHYLDPAGTFSYWAKKGGLADENWNTLGFLQQNNMGTAWNYFAPDEFSFNVNGISGSFYLNYDGIWKVKSKMDLKIDVEYELSDNYSIPIGQGAETVIRAFTKFTLTTGDGTRYVFGGQPNAIEFSFPQMPGRAYFGPPPAFQEYYAEHDPRHSVEANAWHLVKIISPKGHTVDFLYSPATFVLNQVSVTNNYQVNNQSSNGGGGTYQSLVTRYYLEKMIVDNNTEYSFTRSSSTGSDYTWFNDGISTFEMFEFGATGWPGWGYSKLDNLKVKAGATLIQDISFEYIENSSERLKLKRVISKSTASEVRNIYQFDYNAQLLPDYNLMSEDHWGYNNGRALGPTTFYSNVEADYFQSREPDAAFMQAEILQKITYPSGGYTQFVFEPHEYSSVIAHSTNNISCNSINQNKMAGGLRIKKIINNDNVGKTITKEFYYIKNYIAGGALSSGVLSGIPKYYQGGIAYSAGGDLLNFKILTSNSLSYMNSTDGNHITYSEVVEKSSEGFIVHKFQNHDNGFLDKPAYATNYYSNSVDPDWYTIKSYSKLELERGLLAEELYYSAGLKLLKAVKNEYNDDPNRYQDHVRSIYSNRNYPRNVTGYASSYSIYTFYPYLKKKTTTEYNQDGNGTPMVTLKEFQYDVVNRTLKKEIVTTSSGEQLVTDYRYPSDLVANGDDPTGIYNAMKGKNLLSALVEKKITRGGVLLSTNKINFYNPSPGIYVPGSVDVQQGNGALEKRIQLLQYDAKGNLLELQKTDNVKEVYLWGYNSLYPVAKIVNASFGAVAGIVNQSVLNNPANDQSVRTELEKLRTSLPNALVTSYTYSPLKGITSETDPQGRTRYFEYDGFNRLTLVRDMDNNILKRICYNFAGQPENCQGLWYNDEQWQMFTKNDCASGYQPSTHKYTVPAYTYSSLVSPEDANNKALNDINTKGQNEINRIGSCTLICTTGNCTGDGKKCVNNNCEMGTKILVQSVDMVDYWICSFQWVWSDGSYSAQFDEISWGYGGCGMP